MRESHGVVLVAAVDVHLPATRLRGREDHLVSQPLEHGDRRASRLREHRVGDAGDEQRDPHASGSFVRALDRRSPALAGEPLGMAAAPERLDRIGINADLLAQACEQRAYIGLECLE